MIDLQSIFIVGFKDGLIWFPLIAGIGILYSYLKILDISIDGIVVACGITCAFVWNDTSSYTISIFASIVVGIIAALINCYLIFVFKINPIMSGIIFSLAIHSGSVILVGESEPLVNTNLINGILIIPLWLLFITILSGFTIEFFFNRGLGVEIRAFGDNNNINTRKNPIILASITYILVGALYGLGSAIYVHAEGSAKSGGSFEFLIISLAAYLSIDRLISFILLMIVKLQKTFLTSNKKNRIFHEFFNFVSTKSFIGGVLFQTIVFYTISNSPNAVYWKLLLSIILLITLINYGWLINRIRRLVLFYLKGSNGS